MKMLDLADTITMVVFAMIAFGWLALMALVVSSCHAARLGDQARPELPPSSSSPQPESHATESHAARSRPRAATLAARRIPELQRRV
jgi:hypothetical protein